MNRKTVSILLVLIVVLTASLLYLRVFKKSTQPAVVYRELSRLESGLLLGSEHTSASLFTVYANLPAGTNITIWLEYYRNGQYQMRLVEIDRTLDQPQKDLTIILKRGRGGQGAYDSWGLTLLDSNSGSYSPASITLIENVYGEMARSVSQPLIHGEPITLSFHATGSRDSWPDGSIRRLPSDGKPLSLEDEIKAWMGVDRLLLLKLQIDLPVQ